MQSKWDELFSDEERQIALSRLRDCGWMSDGRNIGPPPPASCRVQVRVVELIWLRWDGRRPARGPRHEALPDGNFSPLPASRRVSNVAGLPSASFMKRRGPRPRRRAAVYWLTAAAPAARRRVASAG